MKLINVEHKETEYTFSFTEKELKVLLACIGHISHNTAYSYLTEGYVNNTLNTKYYSLDDAMFVNVFWDKGCKALGLLP